MYTNATARWQRNIQETYQDHYFTTQAMDTGVMLDKQALTSKMCVELDIRNYKLTSTPVEFQILAEDVSFHMRYCMLKK